MDVRDALPALVHRLVGSSDVDEQCQELVELFDRRKIDDDLKEILHVTTPSDTPTELHGWHLDRMAASEYQTIKASSEEGKIKSVRKDLRKSVDLLKKLVDTTKERQELREKLMNEMEAHHETLQLQVEVARTNKAENSTS